MSTQHNDGGPAFPGTVWRNVIGDSPLDPVHQANGMSLRDYFAAHAPMQFSSYDIERVAALAGLQAPKTIEDEREFYPMAEAILRYRYADAMLKAREAK